MIKNVVFDIGNVLTDWCWEKFLADKGFDEEMIKRIAKASIETRYWHEYDRGELPFEEIMKGFISADPEIESELHKAFDDMTGIVTGRDYAIPWIERIKKAGCRVYYLSNFSAKTADECRDALNFIPHCDGGLLSCEVRLIKPDPAFYKTLCEKYSLNPEECVFFDDLEKNIKAAKDCGFNAFVFTDPDKANEDLRSLGIVI